MNTRLKQFLTVENISQASFADKMGIARASVSHILNGRNKPGFDFFESLSRLYPAINLEWLITGKGRMYKQDISNESKETITVPPENSIINDYSTISSKYPIDTPIKQIEKVVIFFTDNTFQEIK